ncbi:MAG: translation initiation factor IF-2 subunit alpha [Methanosphaera sp.]|uniref:translation initiation factor IF-2 subunit alpha n=1 Tax=Methanosphaera sp. BMS TaxID=1789762 RepID=UPI000DC1DE02|nr:translation initiation factor IF-2 subunit alpha [Methanosphaera sp. BMS]AWX32985.1 translation initiation factor IF-2 subunit alpha [Methanosphaera sp. BMS]MBQ6444292.1 translation initiation factor IF-2 subunit alpha [Methanosphaera sp.]MBR3214008.1 translation initiation factor IF-2 subunit alpha [Methanosphaera sp.]
MVRVNKEWPEEGDLIVGTIHKVLNYGAFAKLEEYEGKEAFIHISEVSSGWVKNIRDYVRENQKIVARVLRVNPKKGHVDASLKRIREDQRTRRIQQWKIEQKAEKLLEISAKELNKSLDEAYDEVGYLIMEEFGDLYEGFELASDDGESVLLDIDVDEDWARVITDVAKKNISTPEVQITGYVDITSYKSNGVEVIIEALQSIENDNVEVQCVGAPKYRIMVTAQDYPSAEKILRESADKCISIVEENDGEGTFHRELDDN